MLRSFDAAFARVRIVSLGVRWGRRPADDLTITNREKPVGLGHIHANAHTADTADTAFEWSMRR
jgi:hypothetical protein